MSRTDSAMGTQELSRNHGLGEEHTTRSGLDLYVLGICSGSGLDQLDLALLRYRQDAPNAPLRVELLQVCTKYTGPHQASCTNKPGSVVESEQRLQSAAIYTAYSATSVPHLPLMHA
jgi:hypothetical protein